MRLCSKQWPPKLTWPHNGDCSGSRDFGAVVDKEATEPHTSSFAWDVRNYVASLKSNRIIRPAIYGDYVRHTINGVVKYVH